MMKKTGILLILSLVACANNAKTVPDIASDTARDVAQNDVPDTPRDASGDITTDVAPDIALDTAPEVKLMPGEAIPRPAPGLFDCTADWSKVPARVSSVPLNCYIDPKCHTPMVMGHRAAGGQMGVIAPENTLAAIRAAIIMGVDGVEIDARDTKDGHLVLMHDDTVDRTTDGHGRVSDLTLAQIRALHVLVNKGVKGDFSCMKVPTFEEVLKLAHNRLYIDIDMKTSRVDLVLEAVEAEGMLDYATISTGSISKAKEARKLNPKCSIQVRPDTMKDLNAALDEFDPDPQIIEVPMRLVKEASAVVRPLGLKLYTDVFPTDGLAFYKGDFVNYVKTYDDGCDIEASEFPSAVLKSLDRWELK